MLLLNASEADFAPRLRGALQRGSSDNAALSSDVAAILSAVRSEGDAALRRYTEQFDRHTPAPLTPEQLKQIAKGCAKPVRDALKAAAVRIKAFHKRQLPKGFSITDKTGTRSGQRWEALSAVGLYVPGGRAAYPSSVLMNALPAKIAGVGRLVVTVPTPEGYLSPAVAAALLLANVDEVYPVGGAQAVAALAYGTESIKPVVKIVGPGNAYVAEAKRQVFGAVGIDSIAGPSEILVVSDGTVSPDWLAADLLSQAEHDPAAQSILITPDALHARAVIDALKRQLLVLPTRDVALQSWLNHGLVVVVPSMAAVPALIETIAPEHLQLCGAAAETLFDAVRCTGSIFVGAYTPEAIGDYCGGPNHVLPTSGAARYASGLSVLDFMRRTTFLQCTEEGFKTLAPIAATLADAEGLPAHAASVRIRL